jgi:hypothetical protein
MKITSRKNFLEELKKIPVIQVACERTGISRMTYYRWIKQSKTFKKDVEEAIKVGNEVVCDVAETQLLNLVKDGEFGAAKFVLQSLSKKYSSKVEVKHKVVQDELTDEEKQSVQEAIIKLKNINNTIETNI